MVENSTSIASHLVASYCGDPFWFDNEFGATDPNGFPPLSWCFQHTALASLPLLYLLVMSPVLLIQTHISELPPIPWNMLTSVKFVLSSALLTIKCALFVRSVIQVIWSSEYVPVVELIYPLEHVFTIILLLWFSARCRLAGITSSGVIFCTWLLFVVTGIPEFYSWLSKGTVPALVATVDTWRYVLFLAWFPLVCLQFLVHFWADKSLEIAFSNTCPESVASFVSRQFLCWFNKIVSLGYARPLVPDDLFRLEHTMSAGVLFRRWIKLWEPRAEEYAERLKDAKIKHAMEAKYQDPLVVSDTTPLLGDERGIVKSSSFSQAKMAGGNGYGSTSAADSPSSSEEPEKVESPFVGPEAPSIVAVLFKMFKWSFIGGTIVKLGSDLLQFANPMLLDVLISYTEDPHAPMWQGIGIAILMFVSGELRSLFLNGYFYVMFKTGTKIQSVLTTAVFHKTLRLSNSARRGRTVGEIVNLMAIDVERFQMLTTQCQQFWSTPLQIVLALVLLYKTIGVAFVGGVIVMILLIPMNMFVSIKIKKWQALQMRYKDERQKMTNEILNGVKVIKLYAWEEPMLQAVNEIRNKEVSLIRRAAVTRSFTDVLNVAAPFLVAIVTFTTFILSSPDNRMTPGIAFVSLTLFAQLRSPLMMLSELIGITVQTMISNKRLKTFFVEEELNPNAIQREDNPKYPKAVEVQTASFSWEPNSPRPTLTNIDLTVDRGALVAIVGKVGSGKSSLLAAILGEMEKLQGYVGIRGTCAFASQQAWIQNMSLRDNITFEHEYDQRLYQRVIEACELERDLEILPHGDYTEIGEKGINLSGGQKARVSLARAIYQNADVYFLDDPLSAVDAIVGQHLFEKAIGPKGILKDKTRLLVTHSLHYLKECDLVAVMDDGKMTHIGKFEELMHDQEVADIFKTLQESEEEEESPGESHSNENDAEAESSEENDSVPGSIKSRQSRPSRAKSRTSRVSARSKSSQVSGKSTKNQALAKMIKDEAAAIGRVSPAVYWSYFRAMNFVMFFIFLALFIGNAIVTVSRSLWLSAWSDSTIMQPLDEQLPPFARLGVYGLLGVTEMISLCVGNLFLVLGGVNASLNLHTPLIRNLLRSPLQFFDTTPLGRILNRTGKDMETLDLKLPGSFRFLTVSFLSVSQTIFVISLSTPLFIVIAIPMAIGYVLILKYFISSSRQLQRLASITRSPLYAHFGETIQGASTIRAFGSLDRFFVNFGLKVDEHIMCKYHSLLSNRWLSTRLELIGNLIILSAALLAVLSKTAGGITAGVTGLSVSYALNVTVMLNFLIRQISEVETNVVAVERIKEYALTPTEAEWESVDECRKPPKGWPSEGKIEFEAYSTRYREGLDLALKDVTATIKGKEKVGIAGRTGAGKSSMTLALFRIIEAAGGRITIDGIDISSIGLHELRSRLTIIPQDPVLFSGTLRFNLDPFGDFNDADLWMALEEAHLKKFVEAKPEGLSFVMAEGGDNLSVGQRQLVCLARAVLRRTRILVLDEATASVDHFTDSLIQKTIRNKFSDSTVVTIAHRVNTILDYNRIMVLSRGRVAEFDTPEKLLKDPKGIFAEMAKNHGE